VPSDNIARAINRGEKGEELLESLILEAYGPEGVALLIEAITDSKNRTIMEVKTLLKEHGAKWAEPGSVRWAFDGNTPKFPQPVGQEGREALARLVEALQAHDDIQNVITNIKP